LDFGGENVLVVKNRENRKMTRQEAGRIGGEKVAKERGTEFYRRIGKKGGEKVAEEHGSQYYREIGKKGGESRGSKSVAIKVTRGGNQRDVAGKE
jgi:uncharacterized protein